MKKIIYFINHYLVYLFLWVIALALSGSIGCHLISPYKAAPVCNRYVCTVDVYKTDTLNMPIDIKITNAPDKCVVWNQPQTKTNPDNGLKPSSAIYCKPNNWVIEEIGMDGLKGASWITSRYTDRMVDDVKDYMEFTIDEKLIKSNSIEGIYIAYDSRVTPTWLTSEYSQPQVPDLKTGGKTDAFITISDPDHTKMHVWRYTKSLSDLEPVKKGNQTIARKFSVPCNLWGNPSMPIKKNQVAMYFVIINPAKEAVPSNVKVEEKIYDNCGNDQLCDIQAVTPAAILACQEKLEAENKDISICESVICKEENICADASEVSQKTGLLMQPYIFNRSSEIAFDPTKYTSMAEIVVDNKKDTKDVTGTLYFEYWLDQSGAMEKIVLNSMILNVEPFSNDAGSFSNIVIALLGKTQATCNIHPAPYHKPCQQYQIPKNDLVASMAADHEKGSDKGTILLIAQNNINPLLVTVDTLNRTFHLVGGPIGGKLPVKVNGKEKILNVAVTVDLTGYFLNFAPIASAKESQIWSQCAEGKNSNKIKLYAGTSFEMYGDALPTQPDNYLWYEDFGLVTERFLGNDIYRSIPAQTMSYGVHDATLLLYDDHGITDTDTFKIIVDDTIPPSLSIPSDIFMLVPAGSGPVHLNIGTAGKSDACSDDVVVRNDAPSDNKFKPGVITKVTWTADDGRGNETSKVQQVSIFTYKISILDTILDSIVPITSSLVKTKTAIMEYKDFPHCRVDLRSLLAVMAEFTELSKGMVTTEALEQLRLAVADRLEQATLALRQSHILLQKAVKDEKNRRELRKAATEHLQKTADLMSEIQKLPWPDGR